MKSIKKIGVIVLALAMIVAMSAVAFAETAAISSGIASSTTGLTEITFTSEIDNEDDYVPKTDISYTIAPASSVTAPIQAGPTGGALFTGTSGNSATTTVSFAVNDNVNPKTVPVSFDISKFSQPGVYRYTITQSDMTTEQTDISLNPDADPVKSLDVYVTRATDGTLYVSNAVLSHVEETLTVSGSTYTHATKVDGFVNGFGTGSQNNENQEFTLTKEVSGANADTSKKFPFEISLSYTEGSDAATSLAGLEVTLSDGTVLTVGGEAKTVELAHGESITAQLPKGVTVTVKEVYTNPEGYLISSVKNFSGTDETVLNNATADSSGTSGTIGTTDASITYTNTLDAVSPTGVAMRIAPFMAIGGAGIIFLALSKKSKKEEE